MGVTLTDPQSGGGVTLNPNAMGGGGGATIGGPPYGGGFNVDPNNAGVGGPQYPLGNPYTSPDPSGTSTGANEDISIAHRVLVGVILMIVVLVILTEAAGESKRWAVAIGLLLLGPLLMEGMMHAGKFAAWASNNPIQ